MAGMPDRNSLSQGGFPTRAGLAKLGQAVSTVAKERIVDPVVSTAKGIDSIMRGQTPMYAADESGRVTFNPQAANTALDTAFGMIGGSGAIGAKQALKNGVDPSQLNMFFGVNARTANKAMLREAREMEKAKMSREDIINQTGWFKGIDDKWRFEVPDTDFKMSDDYRGLLLNNNGANFMGRSYPAGIPDVIVHPELLRAYPQLKSMAAKIDPSISGAGSDSRGIYFAPEYLEKNNPYGPIEQSALHELQHQVQDIENFTPGANVDQTFYRDYTVREAMARAFKDQIAGLISSTPTGRKADIPSSNRKKLTSTYAAQTKNAEAMQGMLGLPSTFDEPRAFRYYKNVAGEVEARNVENRFKEGYTRYPWETEDVPALKQFLSFR
jgi:hypothetical protein